MGRAPCCDKANVKRGPWSPEEDAILKNFVEKHGTGGNWIALPHKAGLKRCGKSCRLRWLNYLRPDIKHGGFSEEEDNIICSLYSSIGTRWSIIAAQLPGRTDNDIKNYWNTRLKKKLLGKNVKDDQQTRRLLAKETTVAMRYNTTSIASEAMCASNTPSPSVSFTDPYALETTNVPILLQDPSSAESPVSKTRELFHGTTHISDYSSITSILMRALENNKSENPSQIPTPIINNPHEALYAQRSLNIKAETFDESDTHLPYSLPSQWETCGVNNYQSGMWMQNEVVNNAAHESNFSYVLPGDNQMNDLFYSNNNGSMQIKQEPNYGITTASDTAAYWVSHLDQKPSAYSYILPSEGNTNSTSQGIFQEGIIY